MNNQEININLKYKNEANKWEQCWPFIMEYFMVIYDCSIFYDFFFIYSYIF